MPSSTWPPSAVKTVLWVTALFGNVGYTSIGYSIPRITCKYIYKHSFTAYIHIVSKMFFRLRRHAWGRSVGGGGGGGKQQPRHYSTYLNDIYTFCISHIQMPRTPTHHKAIYRNYSSKKPGDCYNYASLHNLDSCLCSQTSP